VIFLEVSDSSNCFFGLDFVLCGIYLFVFYLVIARLAWVGACVWVVGLVG